jgi:hypothetical protein
VWQVAIKKASCAIGGLIVGGVAEIIEEAIAASFCDQSVFSPLPPEARIAWAGRFIDIAIGLDDGQDLGGIIRYKVSNDAKGRIDGIPI